MGVFFLFGGCHIQPRGRVFIFCKYHHQGCLNKPIVSSLGYVLHVQHIHVSPQSVANIIDSSLLLYILCYSIIPP